MRTFAFIVASYTVAIAFIGAFFVFTASPAHALDSYVSVTVTPAYPEAGKAVAVVLQSYTIDLSGASITWYVNGVRTLSGVGERRFSTTAGAAGKKTSIRVVVVADGETIEKNVSFVPGGVDLVWEATDSYIPPFYRGKALPASNAAIKVVALPHIVNTSGTRVTDDALIYTWNRNGFKRDVITQSGYGRNTLSIGKDLLLAEESVGVEVASRDNTLGAANSVTIPQTSPQIVFYENRPLQGPWYASALANQVNLLSNEITLIAEPYFFSQKNGLKKDLLFSWHVNGKDVGSDWSDPRSIVFGVAKDTSGTASAAVDITHTTKMLQDARASLTITFGGTEGSKSLFR